MKLSWDTLLIISERDDMALQALCQWVCMGIDTYQVYWVGDDVDVYVVAKKDRSI